MSHLNTWAHSGKPQILFCLCFGSQCLVWICLDWALAVTCLGLLPLERCECIVSLLLKATNILGYTHILSKTHTNCPEDIERHLSPVAYCMDMWRQAELSGGNHFSSSSCLGSYVFSFRAVREESVIRQSRSRCALQPQKHT